MQKPPIYIFFDDVLREYKNHYKKKSEARLIQDLTKYLADFSSTSEIMLITRQDVFEVTNWLLKNNLYQFVNDVSNFYHN